jgi:hypothetical protein
MLRSENPTFHPGKYKVACHVSRGLRGVHFRSMFLWTSPGTSLCFKRHPKNTRTCPTRALRRRVLCGGLGLCGHPHVLHNIHNLTWPCPSARLRAVRVGIADIMAHVCMNVRAFSETSLWTWLCSRSVFEDVVDEVRLAIQDMAMFLACHCGGCANVTMQECQCSQGCLTQHPMR